MVFNMLQFFLFHKENLFLDKIRKMTNNACTWANFNQDQLVYFWTK